MNPRPWCACGKYRLAEVKSVRVVQDKERLHVHEFMRCAILRSGLGMDILSQWIDEVLAAPKKRRLK